MVTEAAIKEAFDPKYSKPHLYMLAGYMSSQIPELAKVDCAELVKVVDKFIEIIE